MVIDEDRSQIVVFGIDPFLFQELFCFLPVSQKLHRLQQQ